VTHTPLLLFLLIVVLIAMLPTWPYSTGWDITRRAAAAFCSPCFSSCFSSCCWCGGRRSGFPQGNTECRAINLHVFGGSADSTSRLAVGTGASAGIGYELARYCARDGFDLIVAAGKSRNNQSAEDFAAFAVHAEAVEANLATLEGVDKLYAKIGGRSVDALLANAGRGLSNGFLDQDFADVAHVVDTNVTGTLYLVQKVGRDMRARGQGRILITGSVAGFMPGTFHAVYNASMAFLASFSFALRASSRTAA
jgi:NADP-dependent 3-hydroxy acid dehydrogenase YdfG